MSSTVLASPPQSAVRAPIAIMFPPPTSDATASDPSLSSNNSCSQAAILPRDDCCNAPKLTSRLTILPNDTETAMQYRYSYCSNCDRFANFLQPSPAQAAAEAPSQPGQATAENPAESDRPHTPEDQYDLPVDAASNVSRSSARNGAQAQPTNPSTTSPPQEVAPVPHPTPTDTERSRQPSKARHTPYPVARSPRPFYIPPPFFHPNPLINTPARRRSHPVPNSINPYGPMGMGVGIAMPLPFLTSNNIHPPPRHHHRPQNQPHASQRITVPNFQQQPGLLPPGLILPGDLPTYNPQTTPPVFYLCPCNVPISLRMVQAPNGWGWQWAWMCGVGRCGFLALCQGARGDDGVMAGGEGGGGGYGRGDRGMGRLIG